MLRIHHLPAERQRHCSAMHMPSESCCHSSFPARAPAHWRCLPSPSHAFRKLKACLISPVCSLAQTQHLPRPACRHPLPRRRPNPPSTLSHARHPLSSTLPQRATHALAAVEDANPQKASLAQWLEEREGPQCEPLYMPAAPHADGTCAAVPGRSDYPEATDCAPWMPPNCGGSSWTRCP